MNHNIGLNKVEIRQQYTSEIEELQSQIIIRNLKNQAFVGGEILSFIVAVGFVVLYTVIDGASWTLWMAAVAMIAYLIVRYFYVQNDRSIEKLHALKTVYEDEVKYLDGDFSSFGNGEEYADPKHPYTTDIDIFGRDSLFQRVNRTVTKGGSDMLADSFASMEWGKNKEKPQKELAAMPQWRADFIATVQGQTIATGELRDVADRISVMNIAPLAASASVRYLALLSVGGLWLLVALSVGGYAEASLPLLWAVLQFLAVWLCCSGPLREISKAVAVLHRRMTPVATLVGKICSANFRDPDLRTLADSLDGAERAFKELDSILKALDRRGNILGLLLTNTFFLADYRTVCRFRHWQQTNARMVGDWIDALSRVDVLVSMSTFRYNEPAATDAEVIDSGRMVYEARSLRHPFLGEHAVGNDFILEEQHYYIVTGANMAGKSTFLRAVGINYVLAMNGMPVFADSLRVSVFSLFTSMRTTDDLTRGISYFNAELLRLSQLLSYCRTQHHTLVILDEILKGTNSLDKLNGSRLFLQHISELPVTAVVATHDLELSKMADEHPSRFHNYCFEIELGTDVTYSYKITQGVARNQNATYLLRNKVLNS